MSNFAWYGLQIVVAVAVFVWIGETAGLEGRGIAPALVSMFVAWSVTALISRFIDWRRARSLRAFAIRNESKGHAGGRRRSIGHASDGPELVRRPRIGQKPRKLI